LPFLGTLPPLKALSSYCFEFANALSKICDVNFISFKSIYPSFLYPGGGRLNDQTYPEIKSKTLLVRRRLTWYNPFSWIFEGLFTKGRLLHVQWWSLPLFPVFFAISTLFKIKGKPVVITVHNVLPHEKSPLFVMLSSILFRLGDHFIVHSKSGRNQMMDHYGISGEKISVLPHGSLDFHRRKHVDSVALRNEMGVSTDDKIMLLFGIVRHYKGIEVALKAMPEILSRIPEARLVVAGKLWVDWAPFQKLIENFSMEHRISTFLKYIPSENVHKFFEISDLCIFPYTHFESQSGAGATAVSFRKPMIVSDVGGLPELVPSRKFVVPPNDPSALAKTAIDCLRDPELQEKYQRDANRVSRELDWGQIAKKTFEIYQKLTLKPMKTEDGKPEAPNVH
jgi:glycosyltransferase involved in cell wall biosynthesis